jgi:AMP-binding enzyme C-terminal domain
LLCWIASSGVIAHIRVQGHLDKEGFLFLTGRSKELIKRGGDQVSPYEVEDAIYKHRDVKTVVVFGVPDPIWGERVGAAIILNEGAKHEQAALKKQLHKMLLDDGLQPCKLPDQVVVVTEDDLPKTRSGKYIRIGLAEALGLNSNSAREELKGMKPVNYHEAAVGVKFVLALAVTYVHIGNFDNRDVSNYAHDAAYKSAWEYTRSWYVRQRIDWALKMRMKNMFSNKCNCRRAFQVLAQPHFLSCGWVSVGGWDPCAGYNPQGFGQLLRSSYCWIAWNVPYQHLILYNQFCRPMSPFELHHGI